jgi:uncharacterized protein YeaO (DUF488 family)
VTIRLERVYDYLQRTRRDGEYIVLTDRLWPRGIRKEALAIDEWNREVAPSPELRKWFGHDPGKWHEFSTRYRRELMACDRELERLRQIADSHTLILLYAARDQQHNHPVVLKAVLEDGTQ